MRLLTIIFALVLLGNEALGDGTVGWHNKTNLHPALTFKNHTMLNNGAIEIEDNNLEKWHDDDVVEVYLGDYPLQNVELSSMLTFTVYHMGVLFQNPKRHKWFVVDFFAKTADTIANILMPSLPPFSPWYDLTWYEKILAYFRGDLVDHIVWDNLGYVRMTEHRTGEFNDLKHVGSIYASQLKNLREWLITNFTRSEVDTNVIGGTGSEEGVGITFDMWSVYNASTHERMHESRNCHDFVEVVLRQLKFEHGISPYQEDFGNEDTVSVYRDSLSLTAKTFSQVDFSIAKKRRDFQRVMRFLRYYVYEVTRDLALSRFAATRLSKLGIPFIFRANGKDYFEVDTGNVNPLNYCRIPMDFAKDKEYVPARWNDTRKFCYFPYFEIDALHAETPYSLMDYLLMAEQLLDDALFGRDGKGVPVTDHLLLVAETTLILVGVAKLVAAIGNRNKRM